MKIENSARLNFRLMNENDTNELFELDQDPEVMRYITHGKTTTREDIRTVFLPRIASFTDAAKGWGLWRVAITKTGEFIGWVLVRPMGFFGDEPQFDNLELGWRFKRSNWGKGYATEAAKAVQAALLEAGGVNQFSALAMIGNQASINIMEKLGMSFEKIDIHRDPLGDEEVVFYSQRFGS